jgi:hypothetical protein
MLTGAENRAAKSWANWFAPSTFLLKPAAIVAPFEARLSEMAAPIPRVPPVMSATRPVSVDPTGWLAVRSSTTLDVADSFIAVSSRRCTNRRALLIFAYCPIGAQPQAPVIYRALYQMLHPARTS